MTLRRKILFSFIGLMLINGLMLVIMIEAAYLSGDAFNPERGDDIWAPGLFAIATAILIGLTVMSAILYWTLERLVLGPLDDIVLATRQLASGERAIIPVAGRRDELGQLAESFNYMAAEVGEARTHLEDKVRAATAEIEKTQKDLAFTERLAATGRLAAGVAHEINNPLGGVMNALARLKKGGLTPERSAEYFYLCEEGLKRMRGTVRRILDFSRKRPEVAPTSASLAVRQSMELIRHMLEPAGVTLVDEVERDDPKRPDRFRVIADSGDLQHVFLNLLINAIDAMPRGGTLTVRTERVMDWIVVEIRDTGTGLTLDEVSASFEYFHTTKPVGKGTGLGLSIAHHIVAGYGGALTLNSNKGEGTKATVELPAADSGRAIKPALAASTGVRSGGTRA
ncbi:MAG: HAMP domain-containing histidine kinase [Planctomycetota bacterium]|jgi:signal transduction histidine kinase|nr:HAMP domain-containing histidine kinase [Planctomycetota bacterium]